MSDLSAFGSKMPGAASPRESLLDARLLEAMNNGIRVVTAQRTQSRYLRYAYAREQRQHDVSAWHTPKVSTWVEWVEHLSSEIMWSGYLSPTGQRQLLTAGQEQLIWERVISESSQVGLIDNVIGAVARARSAWHMIQEWRLPDPRSAQFPTKDVRVFSDWMREYHQTTSHRGWLDRARLSDAVAPAIRAGAIKPDRVVMLFGFEEFTPQKRVLLKTLEDLGTKFIPIRPKRIRGELIRAQYTDLERELRAAAHWVREKLDREDSSLTCVLVPELDRGRDTVERVFDEVLSPGSSLPTSSLVSRPYSMSVDRRLIRRNRVEGAMVILRFVLTSAQFSDASSFLRSPFMRAAGAEAPMRARLELWLRQHNVDVLYPGELARLIDVYAQRHDPDAAQSVLSQMLTNLKPLIDGARGVHPTSFWAEQFKAILNVVGWPGDSSPTIVEHQAAEKFRDALNELSGLEFLAPVCGAGKALSFLMRILQSTRFRPQLPEVSVQIMQPDEAFALRFDHVWVAGLNNRNWPEASRANPFLPIEWQRQYKIPGSSSELQLERANRLTNDLCGAGATVVFSYPKDSDEELITASPLIGTVRTTEQVITPDIATDYCEVIRAATDLEELIDDQGPDVADSHVGRAGSRLFALQSQCPFRAFSELRLGTRPWVVPRPGVSALDKGNHLHKALESVWEKIGNAKKLHAVHATDDLENLVFREVEFAIDWLDRKRIRKMTPAERDLEQRRLMNQILDILAMEKERPPFTVVGHEITHKLTVGPLSVDVRIDRVDEVEDIGLLLIDYKLGEHKVNKWQQPRMVEPQLPLYTLAYADRVAGIAFVNGKRGAVGMSGYGVVTGMADGIKAVETTPAGRNEGLTWDSQLASWNDELAALAGQFSEGHAGVDPYRQACQYCDLKTLCRINERRLLDVEVSDNE
ncbi:MAG: PD-(D/E)XK nuclease family protein [Pseudomonadota bacterium]